MAARSYSAPLAVLLLAFGCNSQLDDLGEITSTESGHPTGEFTTGNPSGTSEPGPASAGATPTAAGDSAVTRPGATTLTPSRDGGQTDPNGGFDAAVAVPTLDADIEATFAVPDASPGSSPVLSTGLSTGSTAGPDTVVEPSEMGASTSTDPVVGSSEPVATDVDAGATDSAPTTNTASTTDSAPTTNTDPTSSAATTSTAPTTAETPTSETDADAGLACEASPGQVWVGGGDSIVLDGVLGEWSAQGWLDIVDYQVGTAPSASDLSAQVAFRFTATTLYIAVQVNDDIETLSTGALASLWNGDSVQVGLELASVTANAQDPYDREFGWNRTGGIRWLPSNPEQPRPSNTFAVTRDQTLGVTSYELSLSAADLGVAELGPAIEMSLSVVVNEADSGARVGYLRLTPGLGDAFANKSPSAFLPVVWCP